MSDTTEANAVAYLRSVFTYDPNTGVIRWRVSKGSRSTGSIAGSVNLHGYRVIGIDGGLMRAGRVIWALVTGRFPELLIDHIDGNRANDSWSNLREATYRQNSANRKMQSNTSGFRGVGRHRNCWRARICENYKSISLGYYKTAREAGAAYELAALEIHGVFRRPRRPHVQLDYHPLQVPVATHTQTAMAPLRRTLQLA